MNARRAKKKSAKVLDAESVTAPVTKKVVAKTSRSKLAAKRLRAIAVPHEAPGRARRLNLELALAETLKLLQERGIEHCGDSAAGFVTSKKLAYEDMIYRIRDIARATLPLDATIAVVNKGDAELLRFDGQRAWHFPRNSDGDYTGHHPPSSTDAIAHLEAMRAEGASHLIIPQTAFWWLDFYSEFKAHLDLNYSVVAKQEDTCIILALNEPRKLETSANSGEKDTGASVERQQGAEEWELRLKLAKSLTLLGRTHEAAGVLQKGLRMDPLNARIHLAMMQLLAAIEDKNEAQKFGAQALSLAPDDYTINLALAKAAWADGRMAVVEARLSHLSNLFPAASVVQNELIQFYCARLENKNSERALADRLLSCISDPVRRRHITPSNHLRAVETMGETNRLIEPAIANLRSVLEHLDFSSQPLVDFTIRLLRPVVTEASAIPFQDKAALAMFLIHAGNGFAAVQNLFRSQACYLLALTAGGSQWNSTTSAASVNLAFIEMAEGAVVPALEHLKGVSRIYPAETSKIVWPTQRGSAWPHAPFDLSSHFEKLKSSSQAWPKITVITPSFNQAAYVEETILSVLNQHYPALEYIVVDGSSTDGTVEVLERYRSRIDRLIIEPDEGQTDALNKGLRLATGDVFLWINSDDMLGPGALFMIALTFLEEKADVIAGFCCEHSDHRFGLINLPAVSHATFNIECLGDIFHYWLKGHYFYQPEVAFSRRIFERTGGFLDKSLYFTMDYEFWLRCAAAGAALSVVHWPIGLFRKHEQQKTADMDRTVIEQATVRDRFVIPRPGIEKRLDVRRRLQRAFEMPRPAITVISSRVERIFSSDTARQLHQTFEKEGFEVRFDDDASMIKPGSSDLVIMLVHLHKEQSALQKLRESGHRGAVVGWFWDNHHHVFDNYAISKDFDVCIAGHAFAASYLRSSRHIDAAPVPLCVTQWSDDEAKRFMQRHGSKARADALYGGFVRYDFAGKRNRLIEELIAEGSGSIYLLDENQLTPYFGKSPEQRFADWASHKVSLCLPLRGDLSQRIFDALLAGQIPVVPRDVHDLDHVIPLALQKELPVIRFSKYTASAVAEAHAKALKAFASGGTSGILRRHRYALNHTFAPRIRSLVSSLRDV